MTVIPTLGWLSSLPKDSDSLRGPWHSGYPGLQGQNYFYSNTNALLLLHISTNGAKAIMDKSAIYCCSTSQGSGTKLCLQWENRQNKPSSLTRSLMKQ